MAAPRQSRERLLEAGSALFAERGFAATTTRDIAERAGVDAALIVRHFGSKVGLYLDCLSADDQGRPEHLLDTERMTAMLGRVDTAGPGPIFLGALQVHPEPAVLAAIGSALHSRVVDPLQNHFAALGLDRPRLRAELVAAAFAGIASGRTSGAFPALAAVPRSDIVALVQEAFSPAAGPAAR